MSSCSENVEYIFSKNIDLVNAYESITISARPRFLNNISWPYIRFCYMYAKARSGHVFPDDVNKRRSANQDVLTFWINRPLANVNEGGNPTFIYCK